MRYRDFLGKQASVIVMGSTGLGFDSSQRQANEFLDAYAALGGNFLDTARVYGDFAGGVGGIAERAIGNWMAARKNRDALIIGTKGGHPALSAMGVGRLDSESLHSDLSESLDALMTDHVELYWLHRDDVSRPVGGIMETLNGFIEDGRVGAIGASNWSPARIRAANDYAKAHDLVGFCANQPQFSLANQVMVEDATLCQMDKEMYDFHRETGLACIPFSSQAKGFFAKLAQGGVNALSEKAKTRFMTAENMAAYDRLVALSRETGHSVGALALAYLTCQPFDVYPIVGVSSVAQVEALREAGDAVITVEQAMALRSFD
ncbi:MAG: aldo/keto reductase [Christensenellales bacterium]